MYFVIGGRKATSGLYRVTYIGKESAEPSKGDATGAEARALRRKLESLYLTKDAAAIDVAWPYLGHADRFLRYAARAILEHRDAEAWQERALMEADAQGGLNVLLALVRKGKKDVQPRVLRALDRFDWSKLNEPLKQE